jgi:hypothetical protein
MDSSNNQIDSSNNQINEKSDSALEQLKELTKSTPVLTQEQQKIFDLVFSSTVEIIKNAMNAQSTSDYFIVSLTIAEVIKAIEKSGLLGADKKALAIYMGRKILEQEASDKKELLILYDLSAETILERMIDVSKNVNSTVLTAIEKTKEEIQTLTKPKGCCTIM